MNIIEITTLLSGIATTLGLPIALIVYFKGKKKDRDNSAFQVLKIDEKFYSFLKICTMHPNLHCYLYSDDSIELTNEERITRINIYEILVCVFDNVFIGYDNLPKKLKDSQKNAWEIYIQKWFKKNSFVEAWDIMKETYDVNFVKYMDEIYNKSQEVETE